MLSGGLESKCCLMPGKRRLNLKVAILPASVTGTNGALPWHLNMGDLMPGASYSLELSEMVQNEHRNPEETEDVMISGSSENASRSSVLTESVWIESRLLKVCNCLVKI